MLETLQGRHRIQFRCYPLINSPIFFDEPCLMIISDWIFLPKIEKAIKPKEISINGKTYSISASIELPENVMLAFWWSVFHQFTENFIIGIFIAPTIATILKIWSVVCIVLNDVRRASKPMYCMSTVSYTHLRAHET